MSESINCSSCGAANQLPEGEKSMFCAFCGSAIQNIDLDSKLDDKIHQEQFNKALIEFRDNDFERCIKTLNKIIAKKKNDKNAILYKLMCGLKLHEYSNLLEFLSKLEECGITKIEESAEEDLYTILKIEIFPQSGSFLNYFWYDNTYDYFDKLLKFINFQNEIFKNRILNLFPQIYSWDNHKDLHTLFSDEKENYYIVGFRPQMIDEIKILLKLFYKNKIDISIIRLFIEEIKKLVINTMSYYLQETEKDYFDLKNNKEDANIYQVNYRINCYFEINDTQSFLIILNEFENKMNVDSNINEFITETESIDEKVKLITEELNKPEEEVTKVNWKLYLFLFAIVYICYEWFKN